MGKLSVCHRSLHTSHTRSGDNRVESFMEKEAFASLCCSGVCATHGASCLPTIKAYRLVIRSCMAVQILHTRLLPRLQCIVVLADGGNRRLWILAHHLDWVTTCWQESGIFALTFSAPLLLPLYLHNSPMSSSLRELCTQRDTYVHMSPIRLQPIAVLVIINRGLMLACK